MEFALAALHELIKFVGLLLIGQFLVYVLSFGRHEGNPIYRFLRFLTSPAVKAVRLVTPRAIVDRHIPLVTFMLAFWSWLLLIAVRLEMAKGGPV